MFNRLLKTVFIGIFLVLIVIATYSQENKETKMYWELDTISIIKTTPVKDQARTGTCWDFATTSFIESEILRMGKGEFDLSEMYTVRHTYPRKAQKFVRYHGKNNFARGGQAHDVLNTFRDYGCVPNKVYPGLKIGLKTHEHREFDASLKAYLDVVVMRKSGKITPVWEKGLEGMLDAYLGDDPTFFEYEGKKYTPKSFMEELEFNPDDYIEITSYAFYPMWEKCIVEVPDNWSHGTYYNVPLEEFMEIIYSSLEKGYSITWDGDVSDKYFSHKDGIAIVPEIEHAAKSKEKLQDFLKRYQKEKPVDQKMRDQAFIEQSTTDDHLMHLVGLVKDQYGANYVLTKNSDGIQYGFGGFLYMSDSFLRLRTIAILVHKDAVPKKIAKKLRLAK